MTGPAPLVRVFPTVEATVAAAANRIAAIAAESVAARGRFSVALSGGSTPVALYRLLARDFRDRVDWARVHAWWGDERCVPHTDKDSNARAAREALLNHVPIPAAGIRAVPTELPPVEAAAAYERALRNFDPASPLDLVLLGMGADGHTASLFPGDDALNEKNRWAINVQAPPSSPVRDRVTLTLPLIATALHALFLVTGAEKHDTLARVLSPDDRDLLPAAMVRCRGPVEWLIDNAAGGALRRMA